MQADIIKHLDEKLEALKEGRTKKTRDTLNKLNLILSKYFEQGGVDFSITNIGMLSNENEGPSYETLRATKNVHYRKLIGYWSELRSEQNQPVEHKGKLLLSDNELLNKIPDIATRAYFARILTERKKFKNELNILKNQSEIVIDKRNQFNQTADSMPNLQLTQNELSALTYAVSVECMELNGWLKTEVGQVKGSEYQNEVFPRGFIQALNKVIKANK
ncbi:MULTISPECIES: gamma-mobile-trio protein GmtX [Pseudoalteromonas]|jgi:hypothetical protein|uniref:gamma-mobile-trio protein GmtX n=1 Tax=Pseudoalteromonas TaxID=53246 RepID=UPI0002FAF4A1|nr:MULTISPECIES: gamma-mobile-trio protein GmtX [Pseudoalteromonas]MAY57953.1 hypothetical protein [Pseudoalteromonas sp.]MDN3405731.1 gamma-mobile-trio protein GmtX [Pseudoalteromonas sp. APC 3218]MDN3410693.1 gamma-mobile-trio protein GmtX [Pseudoalteromonas sp. APC 3894]MDN3418007.1 gamma-mobile-trio protein GmtX [Pseudoalteromonas sp. APC 3227]MDN3421715.1 gamma-mobile-trio protein GmtX [Pseudoalteromonas sp. APC 3895]|tara:strand:- start:3029 stop:3682 length:654 start_codon:yes stop_codon:yes gene_type:complete